MIGGEVMRVLGIDIGGTNIKSGIVTDEGEILELLEHPTEAKLGGKHLINKVINIIEKYTNFDRIGISSAGQINPLTGEVIFATDNIPSWTGTKIKSILEDRFRVTVTVENDVNSAAMGEGFYGSGKEKDSFLCLTYGTGIGGAIVEDKKIYYGNGFSAGEFGHMVIHGRGKRCTCGNRGCYERYASTTALINLAKEKLNYSGELNGRTLMELASKDSNIYTEVINVWLEEVMIGLGNLIHIFSPELIVLGGGIMEQPYMVDYIRKNIKNHVMPSYRGVEIKLAELGNTAGILGASEISRRWE